MPHSAGGGGRNVPLQPVVGHRGVCRIMPMAKRMNVVNAKIILLREKQQNYRDGINERNLLNKFISSNNPPSHNIWDQPDHEETEDEAEGEEEDKDENKEMKDQKEKQNEKMDEEGTPFKNQTQDDVANAEVEKRDEHEEEEDKKGKNDKKEEEKMKEEEVNILTGNAHKDKKDHNEEVEEDKEKKKGKGKEKEKDEQEEEDEIKPSYKQALDDKDDGYPEERCTIEPRGSTKETSTLFRKGPPGPGWTSITQPNDAGIDHRHSISPNRKIEFKWLEAAFEFECLRQKVGTELLA